MRIAFLSPFYPYRGGIAQFSDRFYQELLSENHSVEVFSYTTLYPRLLFPGKSQYVPNPIAKSGLPSQQTLSTINPRSYKKTAKAINHFQPDILIVAYWMPYIAIALNGVCKQLDKNIKIVGLVHNAIPHEESIINLPLAKLFLKSCDAFITMGDAVRADLLAMGYKVPILTHEHPIYDHYPARILKNDACAELDIDPVKKTLLFFGLIRDYKGLDLLLQATNELGTDYQLIVAGESYGSFQKYNDIIEYSRIRENIKVFEQYIPDEMVSTLFSASDVLVLPYRSATQSGVVAVAYQMGTPIIATNVGSLGQVIRDSGTGLVVEEISPNSLANTIKEFFGSDYISLYSQNLAKEKTRLSWSSFTKSVEPFLFKLLES